MFWHFCFIFIYTKDLYKKLTKGEIKWQNESSHQVSLHLKLMRLFFPKVFQRLEPQSSDRPLKVRRLFQPLSGLDLNLKICSGVQIHVFIHHMQLSNI